jgi:4-amino-4-deoxy-L-arabinose transferase-like glycosyltransferase
VVGDVVVMAVVLTAPVRWLEQTADLRSAGLVLVAAAVAVVVTGFLPPDRWVQRLVVELVPGAAAALVAGGLAGAWVAVAVVLCDWAVRGRPPLPFVPAGCWAARLPALVLSPFAFWLSGFGGSAVPILVVLVVAVVATAAIGWLAPDRHRVRRWVGSAWHRTRAAYAEPGAHLGIATVGAVLWVIANIVWFQVNRADRLWDHEELTYAQNVAFFASQEGDVPWAGLFAGHYGPMQALLGAPWQWLSGVDQATVVWVNIVLTAVTGVLVYRLVCRLADGAAGLVAGALVLLTPGMLENARGALTMVPATTFFTLALAALVAGRGLSRWRWAAVAGVAVGCMSLSRPMSVAFAPGLIVPAMVWSLRVGTPVRTIVRNGAIAAAGGISVSLWWWAFAYRQVFDYLSTGAQDVATGTPLEVLDHRLYELEAYLGPIAFPRALGYSAYAAATAFVVLFVFGWLRGRRATAVDVPAVRVGAGWSTEPSGSSTGSMGGSTADASSLQLWPIWAGVVLNLFVSLASNTIGWLMLPLVPWVVVAAVAGARRWLGRVGWAAWVAVVLVPVVVLAVLTSTISATPGNRFTWCMEPWQQTSACVIEDRTDAAEWKQAIDRITEDALAVQDELLALGRGQHRIGVAARDHIVLPAAFRLQAWVEHGRGVNDDTFVSGDTLGAGAEAAFLREAGVVVVSPDVEPWVLFSEMVDPDALGARLSGTGFAPCLDVELPDGRVVQILVREPVPRSTCD